MTFANIKKRFAEALRKAELKPTKAVVEMGEYVERERKYEIEDDFTVLVDPEGDAWIFLGQHSDIARGLVQDGMPETTDPIVRKQLHKRVSNLSPFRR